ncbi:MAG: COX15/CtaA family protein [Pseudomonadota bacterium]|nr:COX15/CtaA family protein [Pseudomonadota bacterium]
MTQGALGRLSLVGLAFIVILYGAYVRLTDAGLGCPDWPGCYGKLVVSDLNSPNFNFAPGMDYGKAYREMVHRYLAGLLGFGILVLFSCYWINGHSRKFFSAETMLLPMIMFQAFLGLLTVTLLLKPLIVTGHLIGGFVTLSLLWWSFLRNRFSPVKTVSLPAFYRPFIIFCLIILSIQIFLGGWTSTNYAALACTDLPNCQGVLIPNLDFKQAFTLWRGIGQNFEYGVLDSIARTTIHFTHRVWAIVTAIAIVGLVVYTLIACDKKLKIMASIVCGILIAQVLLGVTNVLANLPIYIAVAHNGVAALLVLGLLTMFFMTIKADTKESVENVC